MSIHRAAAKSDANQPEVVAAIRASGWRCWITRLPCDLFCWHPTHDVWQPLEVKSTRKKNGEAKQDARQEAQLEFLAETQTPVVTTPGEALLALAARLDKHFAGARS